MRIIELKKIEVKKCLKLTQYLKTKYLTADHPEFLKDAPLYAIDLPKRIREIFQSLKYDLDVYGVIAIQGFPVGSVGATPSDWDYAESYFPNLEVDFFSVIVSSLVGTAFGWETQQKGKIIHDLIPIKGRGEAQTGYGSDAELVLHTEDSFHKYRGDYLSFYCIRNDDKVATTFSSVVDFELSDDIKDILFQKRFFIRPDDSHLEKSQLKGDVSEEYLDVLCDDDNRVSLLYGNKSKPFICFDPYYTSDLNNDDQAKVALECLLSEVNKHTINYALSPGDLCIIDNRKVVHGRAAFKAKHNGTDRWLKRINITSDFRKSADSRQSPGSRLIGEPLEISGI